MASYYELQIRCNIDEKQKIENILGISSREYQSDWYQIIEEGSSDFLHALDKFTSTIEGNLSELKSLGIKEEQISFWYMYEYEQQCNMEFDPNIMKRMGDIGVTLCISCWEK
ncbi:hypothetical protein GCM10023231_18940 [Olivibacter ginsenosidimutans]|uniref:DUF4279 domain-containing protein n=1 Tax=Olivibacter ginsenosidimutans TaxID=1176537 RepID=A0ABP9B695_9SPHI